MLTIKGGNSVKRDMPRPELIDVAAGALFLALLIAAAYAGIFGPEGPLPVHFDIHGRPDRWGSRTEAAVILVGLAGLMGAVHITLSAAWRRRDDLGMKRTFDIARVVSLVAFTGFGALMTALAMGRLYDPQNLHRGPAIVVGFLAIIFIAVGAFVGKAKPNPYLGVRIYWTFESRLAWDKANRLLGRIYFLGGLALLLLLPQLKTEASLALAVAIGVGGALASIFESWRVWRADPDRVTEGR